MVIGAAEFSFETAGYSGHVPVQTWVYPQNMKEGFYDYAPAVGIVDFYSELLGEFAFEKLANVQSKTIYGGMENSGCIFYYENSVSGRGRVETLLAHEIAHQWFGDAVTEKDWHHVWLSEGFATYLTSVYMDSKLGNNYIMGGMEQSRDRVIESYKKNPAPVIDTSVRNLRKLLNTNSYQKGAWILHMLRNELGETAFWTGMRSFYEKFKNKNALSEDFMACMEESSGQDLKQFFKQWLYQPGHPELRLGWSWDEASSSVRVQCIQMQDQYIFDFPLELTIVGSDNRVIADTLIRINEADKSFIWPVAGKPGNLLIDPDIKLLMEISENQD
jgi:aminopeptidase N